MASLAERRLAASAASAAGSGATSSGAHGASSSAADEAAPQGSALCLSVSCVGRRLVLGEQTEEELETVAQRLPAGSGHVGFYSYGEISPAGGRTSRLHNQTLTVSVLWERPA